MTENEQLITSFGTISGAGKQISDTLLMKFSRVGGDAADTYGADARLLEYDIHYLRYPLSSINEFSRT